MVAQAYTVAFEGVEARPVEVQCAVSAGVPAFAIVGLPDKAVSEARERVRAALTTMAIALPSKRITVNLSPADMPKEGSHFDLPIAIGLLAALDILPRDEIAQTMALGELALDGTLIPVPGALPAAMTAAEEDRTLLCPAASGPEAAWVDSCRVLGAHSLAEVVRHYTGDAPILPATRGEATDGPALRDLRDVKGQERAKRALEIAAAGRHHLMLVGTPGSGKSMMASRLPGILPPLAPREALETSMIHSLAGLLDQGGISRSRPFRQPHHTASMAAIIGGGRGAKPGEVSLAHNGVLFMDEFPEFPRAVLETLRQPIETGEVMVSRANAHVSYPCRFMLVAAANPCKCGYLSEPARACSRAPVCGEDYLGRISGPLMDRFDLRIEVPPVAFTDLDLPASGETSTAVAGRVAEARQRQTERFAAYPGLRTNADAEGALLEEVASPDAESRELLLRAADRFGLSARGYHRILRVARTIADLAGEPELRRPHIAEALSYRLVSSSES
ncbi:MAG: AAA family ATPase [Rhodobacteraceae bacterium]|uniref:Magnesium chelatase family protein n=2 Tax=Rhodobacterales TaxID=204455 RepID=A0A1U7D545_9RHOB|nr:MULTISPECIES: YifB family Mg chelatase-like AAA ATPase [Salipiger]APX23259.1 magnesium chelatase family protein [Salipiger profundus]MAB04877.1 AAA family ATPase [Paracoccaceae bacterium]GGA14345.1 ATPase AAA [Salipiger profundus]SFD48949.1 magnesium chelatase family protein [Salipiger profundus]